MSNCFQKTRERLFANVSADAQGEWSFLDAALQLSVHDGTTDVHTLSPGFEVLRRWRAMGLNPQFLKRAEQLLNDVSQNNR